jgi:iron complex transport system substrate-binding protein
MRRPSSLLLFQTLFFTLIFLTYPQERVIKDSLGETFEISSPPRKIVSLSPAITEILYFIGAGEKVIAVTRYCDFPEEAKKKEKIGGIIDIDLEKILKIKPDIVFATRGNPLEVIERMKSFGLKVFAIEMERSVEDIFEGMKKIAMVTGNWEKSKGKILELERRVKEIEKKVERRKNKPKTFLKLGSEGLWTCGKKTFINDIILKAGCKNISDFKEGWFEINIEALISNNPDMIIVLSKNEKDFYSKRKFLLSIPCISTINAVKENNIFYLNSDIVERPGPRIVEAIEKIYKISNELIKENEDL